MFICQLKNLKLANFTENFAMEIISILSKLNQTLNLQLISMEVR